MDKNEKGGWTSGLRWNGEDYGTTFSFPFPPFKSLSLRAVCPPAPPQDPSPCRSEVQCGTKHKRCACLGHASRIEPPPPAESWIAWDGGTQRFAIHRTIMHFEISKFVKNFEIPTSIPFFRILTPRHFFPLNSRPRIVKESIDLPVDIGRCWMVARYLLHLGTPWQICKWGIGMEIHMTAGVGSPHDRNSLELIPGGKSR